jgi:hypothetical protein
MHRAGLASIRRRPVNSALGLTFTAAHMKLLDAIFLVSQMPEASCVCCKRPFHQSSEALIVSLTPEYRVPEEVIEQGFEYFLEKEGIEELLHAAEEKLKSREAKVELIAHYAEHDAIPSWFAELCAKSGPQAK